jgi:hypothetical protein
LTANGTWTQASDPSDTWNNLNNSSDTWTKKAA